MSRRILDLLGDITLRPEGGNAITETTAENAIPFDPDNFLNIMVIIRVTNITDGESHSFEFSVETDTAESETSPVVQATLADVKASGERSYEIPLSGETMQALHPDAAFIRTKVTVSGTSNPSINYHSWMMPIKGN